MADSTPSDQPVGKELPAPRSLADPQPVSTSWSAENDLEATFVVPRGTLKNGVSASGTGQGQDQTGRYFGDYQLIEEIARGGMGVVYKARQVNLNRIVALKMILSGHLATETDIQRFRAEAEAAANLDHPGIIPIFEIGQHEGQHYFSMGYIDGPSLAQQVKDGPLQPQTAADLTRRIAEAIAYAHDKGVIHRDLKPSNVLLDSAGEPRVTDFGLARRIESDSGLTKTGFVMGTPSYMPPEQAAGCMTEVGMLSDVYSLGAIFYCLLTGRPPFQAATPADTMRQVMDQEPVSVASLNTDIPRDLSTICHKCLQKEPAKRFQSARALAEDIARWQRGEPITARAVSTTERTMRWVKRNPTISTMIAATAIAVFCAGVLGAKAIYDHVLIANKNVEIEIQQKRVELLEGAVDLRQQQVEDLQAAVELRRQEMEAMLVEVRKMREEADAARLMAVNAKEEADAARLMAVNEKEEAEKMSAAANAARQFAAKAEREAQLAAEEVLERVQEARIATEKMEEARQSLAITEEKIRIAAMQQKEAEAAARIAELDVQLLLIKQQTLSQNYTDAIRIIDQLLNGELLLQLPTAIQHQRRTELEAQRAELVRMIEPQPPETM